MQRHLPGLVPVAALVAASPAAWAHPALFEGGPMASLLHLLTQPDHLLAVVAGIGLAAVVVRYLRRKA